VKPRLAQLHQSGAVDGQVPTWDAGTGVWIPATPSTGGGSGSDPRLLFSDDCAASGLPGGVTSSGDLTYDSTNLERALGGTTASEYETPTFTLRGTVLVVVEGRCLSGHTAGNFDVRLVKGSSLVARVSYQSDTNVVAYNSGGSARGNSTGHTIQDGEAWRIALSVDAAGFYCGAAFTPVTGGSATGGADGQNADAFSTYSWSSGLSGLTAGDSLSVELTTSSTRKVGLTRIRVTRGAWAVL
jgi:hypothetical protein